MAPGTLSALTNWPAPAQRCGLHSHERSVLASVALALLGLCVDMTRVLMLVAAALPSMAFAQYSLTLGLPDDAESLRFGKGRCGETETVSWQVQTTGAAVSGLCADLELWSTTGACGESIGTGDTRLTTVTQLELQQAGGKGEVSFELADLASFGGDGGTCGAEGVEVTTRICGAFKYLTLGGTCVAVKASGSPELIYDAKPPAAPVLVSLEPLDESLRLVLEDLPAEVQQVVAIARLTDGGEAARERLNATSSLRLGSLENGVAYQVSAQAVDEAGNESGESNALEGVPIETLGFFQVYKGQGGQEQGCATSPGRASGTGGLGWLVLIAVGLVLVARRVR